MTSTKRRKVTEIWAILQMVADTFLGGGVSFFHHMQSFLAYFGMSTNKLLL